MEFNAYWQTGCLVRCVDIDITYYSWGKHVTKSTKSRQKCLLTGKDKYGVKFRKKTAQSQQLKLASNTAQAEADRQSVMQQTSPKARVHKSLMSFLHMHEPILMTEKELF